MSDDDEFEDASEEPVVKAKECTPLGRPTALPLNEPRWTEPSRLVPSASRHNGGFAVPVLPVTPSDGNGSRRERLNALRNRMRETFGAREVATTGDGGVDDTMSVISEATSLHSWHRRVLAAHDTVVVRPSDSVSTRAQSVSMTSNEFSPPHEDVRSPEVPVLSSPISPPPQCAPPPLPARPNLLVPSTPEGRVPPPLPPRNPSIRLPTPIANEIVTRLAAIEDTDSFHTPPTIKTPLDNSSRSQKSSTNSNESLQKNGATCEVTTTITTTATAKRRGHTKTNSLDRGLTLAKVIKAGPFPPPSNKSNSLTRQSADGTEEGERNSTAEAVIRAITTELMEADKLACNVLETITSDSSSISSPSSSNQTNASRRGGGARLKSADDVLSEETTDSTSEKCLRITERVVHASAEPSSTKDNEWNHHYGKAGVKSKSAESIRKISEAATSATSVPTALADDPAELRVVSSSMSSIDPITRDVERRMSMKRDGTLPFDQISDDGRSETFSTARSTVEHARVLAHNATGFFRGALQKVKAATHLGSNTAHTADDSSASDGEQSETGTSATAPSSIVRPRKAKKGPYDFEQLRVVQEINNEHTGAVWCIKFSLCGRLLATAGQDNIVRIWVLRSHLKYFAEMRERYQQKAAEAGSSSDVYEMTLNDMENFRPPSVNDDLQTNSDSLSDETPKDDNTSLLSMKPFALFKGHTADVLDLSWSKNYFVLSSGMDRTVKLWHLSRSECLCCFQHVDFVTCVAFLPKDDRYFLSGSLDGKLRLWHIPDKKVAVWNEVQVKFITALTFAKNGKFAVVGTYNGRCFFYHADQLKYHTVVDVRSTRGKNARGHKITGLAVHGDKLLVTSNDSRVRMYDTRDKSLTCKFRGATNEHSQIRAAFSPDGRHVVCGSEDKFIYLWRTDLPSSLSVRKDRNDLWERVRTHTAPVSVAVFAPKPQLFVSMLDRKHCGSNPLLDRTLSGGQQTATCAGQVIVSADLQGTIKIMINRAPIMKAGHSTFFNRE